MFFLAIIFLCSGSRFVALFGEKMAGRQNLLQDPMPLRIIKVDMEDNKSGYGDSKSGFGDNKSGFGDNKKDTAIIKKIQSPKS